MYQPTKRTEQNSNYNNLEKMSVHEILSNINNEDKTIAYAVEQSIPQIEHLVKAIVDKILSGGRLFYIGAGTSGRLGILDASECPPTFGVPSNLVIGIIAGGDKAITQAVEFAEDNTTNGWEDLIKHSICNKDIVIGLTASGDTAYVLSALKICKQNNILTGSISCNPNAVISGLVDCPVEVVVGPEFITGSTRMKSGTAQKMVLNMISTSLMILLGKVDDNKMIYLQLSNTKLIERGIKMILEKTAITDYDAAKELLLKYGSVINAIKHIQNIT